MKRLSQRQWAARVAGLVFAGAASGCTTVTIRRGDTEVEYARFLQGVRVRCEARPDGTMAIDYGGDGGGAQAGAAVGAGIKAAGGL